MRSDPHPPGCGDTEAEDGASYPDFSLRGFVRVVRGAFLSTAWLRVELLAIFAHGVFTQIFPDPLRNRPHFYFAWLYGELKCEMWDMSTCDTTLSQT